MTVTLPSAPVAAAADVSQAAPAARVALTLSREPGSSFEVRIRHTRNGLDRVRLDSDGPTTWSLALSFRQPGTLTPGTYQDVIVVEACQAMPCPQPASVGTIPVSYAVSEGVLATYPVVRSLDPRRVTWDQGPVTVAVTGYGFDAGAEVRWLGAARPTRQVSSRALEVSLGGDDLRLAPHLAAVTVVRDGVVSNAVPLEVFRPGDPPVLDSLAPTSVLAAGFDFELTLRGFWFQPGAVAWFDRQPLVTTVVSGEEAVATVPQELIANGRGAEVAVTLANPDGGTTASVPFTILPNGVPRLDSLQPTSLTLGARSGVLHLTGQNFDYGAVATWDGQVLDGWRVAGDQLTANVPAGLLAVAGTHAVAVRQSGGSSRALSVEVVRGPQDAVSMQVNPAHTGHVTVNAFRLPSGPAWSAPLPGAPAYPLVAEGKVFVTVNTGQTSQLLALDLSTGGQAWGPVTLPGLANAAYEDGGVLVLAAAPGQVAVVQAYRAADGALRWSTPLGTLRSLPPGLTATGGLVYTGVDGPDGGLFALRTGDGSLAWTARGPFPGAGSAPAVTADTFSFQAAGCGVFDGDPATGAVRGYPCLFAEKSSSPAPYPVITPGGGVIDCPSYNLGDSSWFCEGAQLPDRTTRGSAGTGLYPPVVASNGLVWVLGSGAIFSSAFYQWLWLSGVTSDGGRVDPSSAIQLPPIAVNQSLLVVLDSDLIAVDLVAWREVWRTSLAQRPPSPHDGGAWAPLTGLAVGHGVLLVPGPSSLTAFRLTDTP